MARPKRTPTITVLGGTNGAGKSSVGGALIRQAGGDYFNPDEVAARMRELAPDLAPGDANARAWARGRQLLERAIAERKSFTFETTLGGRTLVALLEQALAAGFAVRVWYVGLATPELHVARVRARVERGGHDIPEGDIRRRFESSRKNIVRLLPGLSELRVFDNSWHGEPSARRAPRPELVLHMRDGRIVAPELDQLSKTPKWARPIVAAALKCHVRRG